MGCILVNGILLNVVTLKTVMEIFVYGSYRY